MFLLPKGNPLFENLAATKLKLPEVISKLSTGNFTGYASLVFQSSTAILVFESGKLVSVLLEYQSGARQTGFEAMSTLIELTAQIVTAHAASSPLTPEELVKELEAVYNALQGLEDGTGITTGSSALAEAPLLTAKQAFKKNEVICMVCGKGGFKTLKKHLAVAHQLTPGQYRKQFGIPSTQSLTARSYTESRRKMAEDRGLTDVLAKARETRSSKSKAKNAPLPVIKTKPPVPATKTKAGLPAVKVKAAVPAKVETSAAVPPKSRKAPAKKQPGAKVKK